jgi:hypothetical protein
MKTVTVFALLVALAVAVVVVFYVRRWRLKEQYSLLWLALSVAMLILAAFGDLTEWAADRLDVYYAPSILFFLGLAFVAVMLFHYSLEISRLSDQNRQLAQDVSLMRGRLEEAERRAAKPPGSAMSGEGGEPSSEPS